MTGLDDREPLPVNTSADKLASPYEARVVRVCEYIDKHLDEPLSLAHLSEVAACSKYHFHRVFAAYTGITLSRFIQLARLKRASFRLAFEADKRVIDVALEAGFDSPEAFARAFKRVFNQSPSQFRGEPQWPQWHTRLVRSPQPKGDGLMQVEIVEFATTKVAVVEHCGAPERVYESAAKLIAWRKETGLSPVAKARTFGVPYSNPKTTPPDEFRWDVCGEVMAEIEPNRHGVINGVIPGGRCAMFTHKGSHSVMDDSICQLYDQWLPQSGEELRDYPCFFHYRNFIHEVDEFELLTDVYIPLK